MAEFIQAIQAKRQELETELGSECVVGEPRFVKNLDTQVIELYRGVAKVMAKYRSGVLPKAFKIIPTLSNWEQILELTAPNNWTAASVYEATKLFSSNMKDDMAQRFYNIVLLPRLRDDIQEFKKLNFHMYNALKRALYKPGAFYRGIILPLCEESADATLREAVIISSILKKTHVPLLHSAAALLKIAEMPYGATRCVFLMDLISKNYALPYRVLDALVDHFIRYTHMDHVEFNVQWHQTLLKFCQLYAKDISEDQKEALLDLIKHHSHQQISPEAKAFRLNMAIEHQPFKVQNQDVDPYGMDFLFSNQIVRYKCSCENFRRLTNTYFCRHCMALRCRSCVAHEVDSQYCQHCLEYIPTIDPKFQMNKCASCYQCPSCQHLLSTSILSISPPPNDQQLQDEIVKRTCQLVCEFCRWSSTTFVIEGSRTSNNLGDIEIRNADRINELMSFYKAVSQKEKADKKKRRFHSRGGNTMDLLKKYGIDNTLSPKLFESLRARNPFHNKSAPGNKYNLEPKSNEELAIETLNPAEAMELDELEKLDVDYYYNKNFDLETISSIEQRLSQVEIQPEKVNEFSPISKSLSVKRSLRCKECERNLCRSEYSPISIRFKIQSAAYYHIPELRLKSDVYPIKLKAGEFNIVEFTLQNQTLSTVKVLFQLLPEEGENYELLLPQSELSLGPKDDTVDYEHVPFGLRPLNEETQIIFQSLFKIGFYVKVKPKLKAETFSVRFLMSHDVLLLQNQRENDKTERITHTLEVVLGPVVEDNA